MKIKILYLCIMLSSYCQDRQVSESSLLALAKLTLSSAIDSNGLSEAVSRLNNQDAEMVSRFNVYDFMRLFKVKKFFESCQDSGVSDFVIESLDKGLVGVDSKNEHGNTPLEIALHCKNSKLVDYLLSKGADPEQDVRYRAFFCELSSCKPLEFALRVSDIESLRVLLKYTSFKTNSIHLCMNHYALYSKKITNLLIEKSSDVNEKFKGKTPLMFFVNIVNREILVKKIFENGGDPNIVNEEGKNALMLCRSPVEELLNLFLENGLDINHVDNNGDNLLTIELKKIPYYKDKIIEYIDALIKKGINLNYINAEGLNALGAIISNIDNTYTSSEKFQCLLEHGAEFYADPEDEGMCSKLINKLKLVSWNEKTFFLMVKSLLNNNNIDTYLRYLESSEKGKLLKTEGYKKVYKIFIAAKKERKKRLENYKVKKGYVQQYAAPTLMEAEAQWNKNKHN